MLRDAHYPGSEQFGHTGYKYAHDYEGGIVAADYLGVDREYYTPTDRGFEQEISRRLEKIRAVLRQAKQPGETPPEAAPPEGENTAAPEEPAKEQQPARQTHPPDPEEKKQKAPRPRRAREKDQDK